MDIIQGNKFIALAGNIIDGKSDQIVLNDSNIFYVKTDHTDLFFRKVRPHISSPYKLITHNSDYASPRHFNIDDPLLIQWYGQNATIEHPKFTPLPIGIANSEWPHGNSDILSDVVNQNISKNNFVYMNFDMSTNYNTRHKTLIHFCNCDFVTPATKKPFREYLIEMSSHRYVISPAGNGVDCHRIWEAIYLGVVPIVLRNIALTKFEDLPILFVDSWDDVNPQYLDLIYPQISQKATTKADFNYYKGLICQKT